MTWLHGIRISIGPGHRHHSSLAQWNLDDTTSSPLHTEGRKQGTRRSISQVHAPATPACCSLQIIILFSTWFQVSAQFSQWQSQWSRQFGMHCSAVLCPWNWKRREAPGARPAACQKIRRLSENFCRLTTTGRRPAAEVMNDGRWVGKRCMHACRPSDLGSQARAQLTSYSGLVAVEWINGSAKPKRLSGSRSGYAGLLFAFSSPFDFQ